MGGKSAETITEPTDPGSVTSDSSANPNWKEWLQQRSSLDIMVLMRRYVWNDINRRKLGNSLLSAGRSREDKHHDEAAHNEVYRLIRVLFFVLHPLALAAQTEQQLPKSALQRNTFESRILKHLMSCVAGHGQKHVFKFK